MKGNWWQAEAYQLDPMVAFMSSDMNSISLILHLRTIATGQHELVANHFY